MSSFSPIAATLGGALIGLAATLLLLFQGRVAGVSGIVGGLVPPARGDVIWRVAFLAGMVLGGLLLRALAPETLAFGLQRSTVSLVVAGLLVGFGTRLGGGCTSGHGICGLSRLSPRALVAVLVFMATGVATATIVGRLFGGAL